MTPAQLAIFNTLEAEKGSASEVNAKRQALFEVRNIQANQINQQNPNYFGAVYPTEHFQNQIDVALARPSLVNMRPGPHAAATSALQNLQNQSFATLQTEIPAAVAGRGGRATATFPFPSPPEAEVDVARRQYGMAPSLFDVQPQVETSKFREAGRDVERGELDYSGVQPIRKPDELLSNEKFLRLAQQDPEKASEIYRAFTGGDYQEEMKHRQQITLARNKDIQNAIRDGIVRGDIRRGQSGMMERRVELTDPNNLLGGKITKWEVMPADFQSLDQQHYTEATGLAASGDNPINHIPREHQQLFQDAYQAGIESGLSPQEAMIGAIKAVPEGTTTSVGEMQGPASPGPQSQAFIPTGDYHADATAQNAKRIRNIVDTVKRFGGAMHDIDEGILGAGGAIGAAGRNMVTGIPNLINMAAQGVTGKPIWPYIKPQTEEEGQEQLRKILSYGPIGTANRWIKSW